MYRRKELALVLVLLMVLLAGCASETPWRKATVTTYELAGLTIEHTKTTGEALYAQKLITDEQVGKLKAGYNKAREIYISAGNSLKLAGKTEDAAKRDQLLVEYDKLLAEFRKLAYEVLNLVNSFIKK